MASFGPRWAMNLAGLGIALIVVGLLATFASVFGVQVGVPLAWLGLLLLAIGVALVIVSVVIADARRGRTGPGRVW